MPPTDRFCWTEADLPHIIVHRRTEDGKTTRFPLADIERYSKHAAPVGPKTPR